MMLGVENTSIRKVLILTKDIYSRLGGGEQVYRTLIEDNPKIEFYFFTTKTVNSKNLPHNAHPVQLKSRPTLNQKRIKQRYDSRKSAKNRKSFTNEEIEAAERAEQFARSAAGETFDLIDIPEYEIVGDFLRESLTRNKVDFKVLTLFIHGSLSKTLEHEEGFSKDQIMRISELEKRQREHVDFYFTLDNWYPKQLELNLSKCLQINPWLFIKNPRYVDAISTDNHSTSFVYFGRWERRKGVDKIPNFIKLISQENIKMKIAGDTGDFSDYAEQVVKSATYRNISVENLATTNLETLCTYVGQKDVLIVPSRFDSFNLVALEGIANGMNVAISQECGAYHHLSTLYPDISFIEITSRDIVRSAQNLSEHLEAANLNESKIKNNLKVIDEIIKGLKRNQYETSINSIIGSRIRSKNYSVHGLIFTKTNITRNFLHYLRKLLTFEFLQNFLSLLKINIIKFFYWLRTFKLINLISLFLQINFLTKILLRKATGGKQTIILRPLHFLHLSSRPDFPMVRKVTYGIRSLRFSGYNTELINAANLIADLDSLGLEEESRALSCVLKDQTGIAVFNYLENRRTQLLNIPIFPYEAIQTLHSKKFLEKPKISVIVSDFNAASKLPLFLERLSLCPELRDGSAEILLIDANSNSPDAEISVKLANELGISLRAVRVSKRVTIQDAWNYGITQARGDYISFLGVDETIYPTALTALSEALNSNPEIDWVMSNSIVTEVDAKGEFRKDLMINDRRDANVSSPFLETCYVSYVGGMYRKNIHEKFGYYDSTFKGAGDTEFKSRVLPSLKVTYINAVLGEFLNYPEERTTASERIELEDIRAWYIFRTPGGLIYQASLADRSFMSRLGENSLGYRKSYCEHKSTDIEIASTVYHLAKNGDYSLSDDLLKKLKNADQQLQTLRNLLGFGMYKKKRISIRSFLDLAKWFDIEARKSAVKGAGRIRLDNMFEQHIWYW